MDYESIAAAGSMLGSGAVMVMDSTTDIARAALSLVRFYAHESCGKCTPCREGVATWMPQMYRKLLAGLEDESSDDELDQRRHVRFGVRARRDV